jgi:type II secretory pathway component PulC
LGAKIDGILHLPSRNGGAALIRHGKATKVVRPGEEIVTGARLISIAPDHVVLDNRGRKEKLVLLKPQTSGIVEIRSNRDVARFAQTDQGKGAP